MARKTEALAEIYEGSLPVKLSKKPVFLDITSTIFIYKYIHISIYPIVPHQQEFLLQYNYDMLSCTQENKHKSRVGV